MSDDFTMVVYGDDTLIAQFEALARGSGKVLLRAAEWGAQIVADDMAERAPKSTWRLTNKIGTHTAERTADTAIVDVGPQKSVFYGRFQETGTVHHPAQPFMRPAVDENEAEIVDAVGSVIEQILGDVLG